MDQLHSFVTEEVTPAVAKDGSRPDDESSNQRLRA